MGGVNIRNFILFDKFPGYPNPNLGIPTGGFTTKAGSGHDVTIAVYPVGTKIQIYTDGTYISGPTTLTYLKLVDQSNQESIEDLSTGPAVVCAHSDATIDGDTSDPPWTTVTNCGATNDGSSSGMVAIPCGTFSNQETTSTHTGQYGWFWTGGVCPYIDITFFDGQSAGAGTDISTGGNVATGDCIHVENDTSAITIDGDDLSTNTFGMCLITDD